MKLACVTYSHLWREKNELAVIVVEVIYWHIYTYIIYSIHFLANSGSFLSGKPVNAVAPYILVCLQTKGLLFPNKSLQWSVFSTFCLSLFLRWLFSFGLIKHAWNIAQICSACHSEKNVLCFLKGCVCAHTHLYLCLCVLSVQLYKLHEPYQYMISASWNTITNNQLTANQHFSAIIESLLLRF